MMTEDLSTLKRKWRRILSTACFPEHATDVYIEDWDSILKQIPKADKAFAVGDAILSTDDLDEEEMQVRDGACTVLNAASAMASHWGFCAAGEILDLKSVIDPIETMIEETDVNDPESAAGPRSQCAARAMEIVLTPEVYRQVERQGYLFMAYVRQADVKSARKTYKWLKKTLAPHAPAIREAMQLTLALADDRPDGYAHQIPAQS